MVRQHSENISSDLIRGTLSLTVATVIVKILGVIYKIPLASVLGEEGMGYFNSAYTVYSVFYLLCTAGVPKAVMLIILGEDGQSRDKQTIMRMLMRAFFTVGAVLCGLFLLLAKPLSVFIGNEYSYLTMLVIAPAVIFVSVSGVLRGYLNSVMNMLAIATSQIVEGVVKLALGLIFAYAAVRMSMPAYLISAMTVVGVTVGSLVCCVYLLISSKIKIIRVKTKQKYTKAEEKTLLLKLAKFAVPITLSAAVMSIANIADLATVMNRMADLGYTPADGAALYGNYTTVAVPLFNLVISLVSSVSVAFLPAFIRSFNRQDEIELQQTLRRSLTLSAFICAPLIMGISFYPKQIIAILFPQMNAEVGADLLCALIPGAFFMSMLLIVNSLHEACGSLRAPFISMLVGGAVKLAVSYVLMARPEIGILGAPIGTVSSYAVSLCISLFLLKARTGLRIPMLSSNLLPYLNSLVAVLASIYVKQSLPCGGESVSGFAILVVFCAFVYLILSVFSGTIHIRRGAKRGINCTLRPEYASKS